MHRRPQHPPLQYLDMRANYFSDASAEALATMLRSNSTLTALNLRSNDFTLRGERVLAAELRDHRSIVSAGEEGPSLEELGCTVS